LAGDLPLVEGAIILDRWEQDELAAVAPALKPEHILHEFGPSLRIAGVPETDPSFEGVAEALGRALERVPEVVEMDPVGALGLAAFQMRSSGSYVSLKADRRFAGAPWDTENAETPDPPPEAPELETEVGAPLPPAQPLRGRIAIGLLLVDGPADDLIFTTDEQTVIVAEIQNGLSWLASQAPDGDVTWVYDIRPVALDVRPDPNASGIEPLEAVWRDPAFAAMGYEDGLDGAQEYANDVKANLGTARAYCAFFTKYPVGHFAYAALGGPRLVMHAENDAWGPNNIDRVFAHETCHIFGAPDEYASSGCDCNGAWGTSRGPNGNCETCAEGGAVGCIMLRNEWAMCSWTPGHLGW
jgi:hypothetical protein